MLYEISNSDQMTAHFSYAVWTREKLVACDIIGAETALKAIYASLCQGKKVNIIIQYARTLEPWGNFRVVKTVLTVNPNLYRWHLLPVISSTDTIPVYGWNAICPAAQAVANVLDRYTIWPVLPEWAEDLFKMGQASLPVWNAVTDLESVGVDYAFLVRADRWETIIADGVREGRLKLP